jgi:glutathione S-transferase
MPLKLYQSDLSPYATRVRILAQAKGLKLENVSPPGGALKSPEYLAINPLGKIPSLDHDGEVLIESEIICEYLEDAFPTPTLRPVDPMARAKVRLLSRMGDLYLSPPLVALFGQLNPKTRDPAIVDRSFKEIETAAGHIARILEGPDYAAGGRLSLADCTLAPLFAFVESLLVPVFGKPNPLPEKLQTYFANAQNDPHIARGLSEMRAALAARMKQQAAS